MKINEWTLLQETRKVVGIKKDAFQQPNLENSSPAKSRRIHQHHWENKDNLNLFQPGLRVPTLRWPATPPSRKASERRWHPNKRDLSQGWQRTTTFQKQATIFKKVKQKEEEADSFISPAGPPTYLLEGSLPPIATLQTSQKNIDIKNQPSGKHLRYLFIRHNLLLWRTAAP